MDDRPFACFATAFALALLAHQLWWRGLPAADLHGLVVALAAWVVARPGSPRRLAALATAETIAVARDLPAVGDHTLLALATSAAFAGTFGAAVVAKRSTAAARLFERFAPFLRLQAVVLYGAAALAKLNDGFLDPATSCAGPMVAKLGLPIGGAGVVGTAIAATVVVEGGLAVLLSIARTRTAGVALGAVFHAVLALAGNVPFAAYALALYIAFLPAAALPARGLRPAAAALALVWLAGHDAMRISLAATLLALAVLVVVPHAPGPTPGRVTALGPGLAAVALLLVVNAASPYAGLKTEASFAMFSNLQTEPGHWNHLLVPEAVRVFGAQDELVRLEASTAAPLERRRRAGILMVRQELERFLREHPGERATYADAADPSRRWTAEAATLPRQPLRDRLLNFYDVREGARGRC